MKAFNLIIRAISLSVFLLFFPLAISAQDYTVNWSDTSTYRTTCGKIVPSQWSVKNDSCVMMTPYLRVEAAAGCQVSFTFRINQSGNGETTDKCYVWHSVDAGEWVIDTLITAGGSPAVYTYSDQVSLNFGHFIRFRVAMRTDNNTEFWAIKGGDILVSDGIPSQTFIMSYSTQPLAPDGDPFLPVELVMFSAQACNGFINLSWVTASETNNDYFTIERSENATDYSTIGIVTAAGNSNEVLSYELNDNYILPNDVAYYRLRQTDFDGKTVTIGSAICSTNNSNKLEKPVIYVTPENTVMLTVASDKNQIAKVGIYDLSGRMILENDFELLKGNNTLSINANDLNAGTYVVALASEVKITSEKINIF